MVPDFGGELLHGFVVLLHHIPFIHHNNAGFARFMGIPGNMLILFDNAFLAVDDH
ncbi:hypothetical protein D3C81_2213330 [compost metagenome]